MINVGLIGIGLILLAISFFLSFGLHETVVSNYFFWIGIGVLSAGITLWLMVLIGAMLVQRDEYGMHTQ